MIWLPRTTDNSTYFVQSLGMQGNESRLYFICRYFSFYKQLKFRAQLSWAWKMFYNLRAWILILRKTTDFF